MYQLHCNGQFQDNVATLDVCKCTKEHVALDLTTRFRMKVKVRCEYSDIQQES